MTLVYLDLIVSFIVVAIVGLPTVLGLAILFNNGDLVLRFFPGFAGAIIGISVVSRSAKTMRSISVSNVAISGQRYFSFRRTGFKISEIDIKKSNNRSIFQKLVGQQIIYSLSGDRIIFYRRIFKRDTVKEILLKCNLQEST